MADFSNLGYQFVQHFYQTFDTNRQGIAALYTESSMLTFEGEQFQGTSSILGKLSSFGDIKHQIKSFDAQPTQGNGIVVFINGDLSVDGGAPLKFAELFILLPTPTGGYYVHNNLFRLNIG